MLYIQEETLQCSPRVHEENQGVQIRAYENNSHPRHNVYISKPPFNGQVIHLPDGVKFLFSDAPDDCGYVVEKYTPVTVYCAMHASGKRFYSFLRELISSKHDVSHLNDQQLVLYSQNSTGLI